jgi:hypothetical protein
MVVYGLEGIGGARPRRFPLRPGSLVIADRGAARRGQPAVQKNTGEPADRYLATGACTWSRPLIRIGRAMRAGHSWRGLCIAPTYGGPRNAWNNSAHEPTSGRSTLYESGHLIRGFRDIGRIFSLYAPVH